jgi:hypothetical protein
MCAACVLVSSWSRYKPSTAHWSADSPPLLTDPTPAFATLWEARDERSHFERGVCAKTRIRAVDLKQMFVEGRRSAQGIIEQTVRQVLEAEMEGALQAAAKSQSQ